MSVNNPEFQPREIKQEKLLVLEKIGKVRELWSALAKHWQEDASIAEDPLHEASGEAFQSEEVFKNEIESILNCGPEEAEALYQEARKVKEANMGNAVHQRAAIQVTNVCRENCLCCPMRKDNLVTGTTIIKKMSAKQIVAAIGQAYENGIRDMFIQGGEDVTMVSTVVEAVNTAHSTFPDIDISLNLGNLSPEQYAAFHDAGVKKYVIKFETANPKIHQGLRQQPLERRMRFIMSAKQAGLEICSGNIIGLPEQTDRDLADDLLLLGRLGVEDMISSTTYTPSEVLPEPYKSQQAGDWEKTKRFIALLRLLFPKANIEAPSNVDGSKIIRANQEILGQTELIRAGANEIMVEFTPKEEAGHYGLYDTGDKRHVVHIENAQKVVAEVNALEERES